MLIMTISPSTSAAKTEGLREITVASAMAGGIGTIGKPGPTADAVAATVIAPLLRHIVVARIGAAGGRVVLRGVDIQHGEFRRMPRPALRLDTLHFRRPDV